MRIKTSILYKCMALTTVVGLLVLTPYATAQSRSLMFKDEQSEDMRYYQPYKWNTPIERKAIYEAKANGQYHMLEKMSACRVNTMTVEQWLNAFKAGSERVLETESAELIRDMNDKEIIIPDDGLNVAVWLVRDYAEAHYLGYTGKNLAKLQDKFFSHCLAKLPVKLFTKEAQDKLEAKIQAEMDREMAYP